MRNLLFTGTPMTGLFRDLTHSVRLFVHEELELAKSEMSEKMSRSSHNAIGLVIGGLIAYAGLIILLGGMGLLAGFGFQKMNLDPMLANVLGLGAIGLIVILVGAVMVLKAVKAFSAESLAPKRTIATLKHLQGSDEIEQSKPAKRDKKTEAPKRSPDELKAEVITTEDHIGETLQEIFYRVSPARVKDRAVGHLRTHPYTWSLGALGGGIVSGLLLMRKFHFRK